MTYFIRNGNTFSITSEKNLNICDSLPAANYSLKHDPSGNRFYLENVEPYKIEHKIYGDVEKKANRIVKTFLDRETSTGVMLAGEKGSGKTMLAKFISNKCINLNIPTIIINSAYCGEEFNSFIQSIQQPCVIVFDEFEKIYREKNQEQILTLLDGTYPTKNLFLFTCNDTYRVDTHLKNRPGRIFYLLEFDNLDIEFIREYAVDNLNNQEYVEEVVKYGIAFKFNFDMLKALVDEMNRFNESAQECIQYLNIRINPDSRDTEYEIIMFINGQECKQYERATRVNPASVADGESTINIEYFKEKSDEEDDIWSWKSVEIDHEDLVELNSNTATYIFKTEKDGDTFVIRMKPSDKKKFDYRAF